jgi:hypothetical protein
MPKRSSKAKTTPDDNQLAALIVQQATEPEKNPAAVALGHLGGLKGGPARAKRLSKKRRSEIAATAARVRWKRRKPKPEPTG